MISMLIQLKDHKVSDQVWEVKKQETVIISNKTKIINILKMMMKMNNLNNLILNQMIQETYNLIL